VHWLKRERSTTDRLLPGLDEALADVPLMQLEEPPSVGLEAFREAGGPGLLVPRDHLGAGATAVEAVQVQRAIGSRAPSVAVAVTMHHYSIATFMAFLAEASHSNDWLLLDAVAEGRPDAGPSSRPWTLVPRRPDSCSTGPRSRAACLTRWT
jgi:alkylation response protein AidB-like acyl-CoA dehydrogenase